jgi:hypothetical protein
LWPLVAIINTATSPRKKPLLWPHKLRLTLLLQKLLPLKRPLLTLPPQKKLPPTLLLLLKPLLWPHKLRLTLLLQKLLPLKRPLLTLPPQKKLPPTLLLLLLLKPLLHLLPWMPQWPLWIRLLTTPPKSPL